jgi:hypothetical protein
MVTAADQAVHPGGVLVVVRLARAELPNDIRPRTRSRRDQDDILDGQGGDDLICGRDGNDDLRGLSGNDQIWGGDGTDTITGGADTDTGDGGPMNDTCDATTETRVSC